MQNNIDFKKKILYPACAMFFVLVFVFFFIAAMTEQNVSGERFTPEYVYDDATGESTLTFGGAQRLVALPVQTLLGLFLFSLSVFALGLIFKLEMSRIYLNLLHYIGTILSFFIFVLAMTGNIGENGVPKAMVICLGVSVLYFIVRGAALIVKKLFASHKNSPIIVRSAKYFGAVFTGFTVIVFAVSLFALITQISVIANLNVEKDFIHADVLQETSLGLATPLAPTVWNYLRYLASAAVFMLAYAVLFTKLNKVARVLLNFAILAAGYVAIWIFGLEYFRVARQNSLPAVIAFLVTYAVVFTAVCIYRYVKTRNSEQTENYQRQFK